MRASVNFPPQYCNRMHNVINVCVLKNAMQESGNHFKTLWRHDMQQEVVRIGARMTLPSTAGTWRWSCLAASRPCVWWWSWGRSCPRLQTSSWLTAACALSVWEVGRCIGTHALTHPPREAARHSKRSTNKNENSSCILYHVNVKVVHSHYLYCHHLI